MMCACERWCVTKLCVKDGVCDKVVWKRVCDKAEAAGPGGGSGRREREAEAGGGSGIQNQKQEPHTKMRGKNTIKKTLKDPISLC